MVVDKPAKVMDLESKSAEDRVAKPDPLAGISTTFRSQIPKAIARRAKEYGGEFYTNVVRMYCSSSSCSSFSPRHPKVIVFPIAQLDEQKEAKEETRQIPDTLNF